MQQLKSWAVLTLVVELGDGARVGMGAGAQKQKWIF